VVPVRGAKTTFGRQESGDRLGLIVPNVTRLGIPPVAGVT
jgi:hypothetical protein